MNLVIAVVACVAALGCCGTICLSQAIRDRFSKLQSMCDVGWSELLKSLREEHDVVAELLDALRDVLPYEAEAIEKVAHALEGASQEMQTAAGDQTHRNRPMALASRESELRSVTVSLVENAEVVDLEDATLRTLNALRRSHASVLDAQLAYNDLVMIFNAFRRSLPAALFAPSLGYRHPWQQFDLAISDVAEESPEYAVA